MASYYVWSGATGSANGTSWANAYTTMVAAFTGHAAGDTYYVAHDHAESTAGATLTSLGTVTAFTRVICVNRAGSVPPVSADRRATAQISTTGSGAIECRGFTHYDGIIFNSGTSGAAGFGTVGQTDLRMRFDNCSIRLGTTLGTSISIGVTGTTTGNFVEFNNTTVQFNAVGQWINVSAVLVWRNTPSALLGVIPTGLFSSTSGRGGSAECIGVDFSAAGSGKTLVQTGTGAIATRYRFTDCKLDAAVTKSATQLQHGATEVDFVRSGASGVNYTLHSQRYTGTLTEETTIVRTGGASDGTTTISWKIVTTAQASYSAAFECPPIAIWNDTTGSSVTATVEGIAATLPTDQEIWLDVEYLGDASSPQGSFVNDGKPDLLATATNQTSSSAVWGGSTAKFQLNVSFTAQQKGWIYARVKCAKASSTFYIDPLVTLT